MALIHVFNGINEKTSYTFNGSLRANIPGIDWNNSIILKGGYRIDPDYEVKENDVIYVRKTPGALVVTALVVTAVTAIVVAGVSEGVSTYQKKKTQAALEDANRKAKAAQDQSSKLPFIRGARNQPATGRTFPYMLGKSLMTPYRLCPAHYTIAGAHGSEQYYNVVLEVAYNNLVFDKIKMGETVVKQFSGTTPQDGVYSFDAGTYYDERNIIEIKQTGAFTNDDFNKKIICTELSTEIPHRHASSDPTENAKIEAEWRAGVVQELPTNAQSVELIALFDGLQKFTDSWQSDTITLSPQWANVDNPTENDWHDFTTGFNQDGTYSNTFTYNTRQQMRFVARQDFTAAQAYGKQMRVRIRRLTPKEESNAKDTVYLLAVQTKCYDAKKSSSSSLVTADVLEPRERDKCVRIGLRIAANINTEGQLDAISVIAQGCARTWDGESWSETKTPTSNLAAWALEILTSPHHKPSQYSDEELDLDTFGAWYEYCEAQGFKADGVISSNTKKQSIIETLCGNSNAALVYNPMTGLIEVAIDNGRDYSVALLNSENIIGISTVKKFERKTDGKKVTYINGAAGYDVDSVTFMRDGGAYDPATDTLTETALEYITSYQHAFKYAWRKMAEEIAQPRIVTVRAGRESAYYPLYSRVELQHKSLKIGLAHGIIKALVWQNSYLKKIILDGSVTFPANVACGVIINCISDHGRGLLALKVEGTGKTGTLDVITTLRNNAAVLPAPGNALSFGQLDTNGEFTTVTSSMKITNAEETDDGYTLTLVDYNPALYEYGTLPEYKTNITNIPNGSEKTVEQQRAYVTEGDAQAIATEATGDGVQAAVDTIQNGYRFTNIYNVRPVPETLEEIIAKMDDDAKNQSASISMSEEEILIKVENLDTQQRAYIDLTKDEILAEVDDMARELTGLIDVQAGAVTALVEGGGAAGELSLSLNLPVMIDATTRAALVTASTEEKVAAVYALVAGTEYYGIKGNASNAAVKALWDDAIAGGLLASQIVLSADQINIAGKTIYTSSKTEAISAADAAAAQSAAISAAAADATSKANTAQSNAETYADTAAGNAETAAKGYANTKAVSEAESKRNDIAQKLGYANYDAMVTAANNGETIIDGGYLRTSLIEVEDLLAQNITLQANGYIESSNYAEDANGVPTAGFKLDAANNIIKSYDMQANGGSYNDITAKDITLENGALFGTVIVGANYNTFINNIITHFQNCKARLNSINNCYNASGYLLIQDGMTSITTYFFRVTNARLQWSNTGVLQTILFEGIGVADFYNMQTIPYYVSLNASTNEFKLFSYKRLSGGGATSESLTINSGNFSNGLLFV